MYQGVVNISINQDLIVEINPQKNIRKDQIQEEGLEKKILHTEDQEVEKENQEDITVVILQMLRHQYPNQDHLQEKAHQESKKSKVTEVDLLPSPDIDQNHPAMNQGAAIKNVGNNFISLIFNLYTIINDYPYF